jgi:hypothetical protein
VGGSLYAASRGEGSEPGSAGAAEINALAGSADPVTSQPAEPPAPLGPTTSVPPSTVPLGPLALPLTAEDANIGTVNKTTEYTPEADGHGFCNIIIDSSELVEQQASNLAGPQGHYQLGQWAGRFDSEAGAEAFMAAIESSLICSSWDDQTIDGSQHVTISTVLIEPTRTFGDHTVAWQSTLTYANGIVLTQRGYEVRRQDRVVAVNLSSTDPSKLNRAPDLMATMLERLGYGP